MTLHCTLVRGPHATSPCPPLELTVEAPHGSSGLDVQQAMEREYSVGELTVGGLPLSRLVFGTPPLISGAVLVDGAGELATDTGDTKGAALLIAVHSGPAAGTVLPLRRGTYRIGRSGTEIALPDAALSREHARLDVTDTAIIITDLGSINGTLVDGKRVGQSAVSTRSLISCGNSTLSVVSGPNPAERLPEWAAAGSSVAEPIKIPHRAEGGNRGLLLVTAALPLLIGVGLAVITGMWMFLAFTAVSAVSVLVPLLAGRRQRRRLRASVAAAVEEDKERRRRSAPSAAELVLRGQPEHAGPGGVPSPDDQIVLRLGLAEQQANISLDPAEPDFEAPTVGLMPMTLQLSDLASVRGPQQDVAGLVRFIIMQLTSFRPAERTRILVHGAARLLPLAARYLPPVVLSSNPRTTLDLLERDVDRTRERGVLILMDGGPGQAGIPDVTASAISRGWHVLDCTRDGAADSGAVIELRGTVGRLSADAIKGFFPDLVPERAFDRYCRNMASRLDGSPTAKPLVPQTCSLADLLPGSATQTPARWHAGHRRHGLAVPIGMAAHGPRMLDLDSDGPHLLVAGTTGSGKSELLRGLTAALALSYPPDKINFLFFDFKGGSGLGPLTGLPHCVGMLTDLTRNELERTLTSLRAEIRYREELLSAVQAPDLAGYRAAGSLAGPLPHLVLIIDEFRMLVEDAPEALRELMRIAAIGRSLGIHLVMATQRPQGALTADIRANVTTSIALRVQSEMESADIINSRIAAGIPLGSPGRAYLARGTEEPVEFQTASLAGAAAALTASGVTICLATEALRTVLAARDGNTDAPLLPSPAQAAGPIVESLVKLWAGMGGAAPRRPVAAPLPPMIIQSSTAPPADGLTVFHQEQDPGGAGPRGGADPAAWCVQLGLVDEPDRQRVSRLSWRPGDHGHLALVGGTGSGVDDALSLAVQQLMGQDAESHLYILDAGTSFSSGRGHPRVGAVAGPDELRRAVRILERVALELSLRLRRPTDELPPPIVLLLSGWGSWVSAFRAGPLAWAEDLVQDIVRDGAGAGITVLMSGDREVVTGRQFAGIPNRAYFPKGSTEESRLAWPRLPDVPRIRGRAVVFGPFTDTPGSAAQFYLPCEEATGSGVEVKEPAVKPFRVEALPAYLAVSDVLARAAHTPAPPMAGAAGSGNKDRRITVGLGGDELVPAVVRLPPGAILPVLGGPSSGRSSFLAALPQLNPHISEWLVPGPENSADSYWAGVRASAAAGTVNKDAVLLVDDPDTLTPEANRHLADLQGLGFAVILTAAFSPALGQRVPLAAHARGSGNGLLIAPRNITDGDFFGIRFELEGNPPPGRAVLIADGRPAPVQLAAASGWTKGPGAPRLHGKQS
ncbi:FtsK/SpoIIIE domain-containing protein [Arthrobacter sp. ISL-72]|uniref:FtsK/SpoIIIE domain-containing protein n=1 Tax=Arthrobacter sp. ISL-72 TaxID=2819114 RepID=UPI001BECAA8D|nr:FtsK/SpoIIIE domain-containing protein [Arthrobacter sp. ISL-72]MBT2596777.1 FHA domain-containing protein [Arthrobacter sp. ISL-72]